MADSAGVITDSYDYTAFGELYTSSGSTANDYLFAGQMYDANTDLYQMRARYYSPSLGRFMGRDGAEYNLQNPIELNRYGYTANNPVNYTDPSGYGLVSYAKRTGQKALAAIRSLPPLACFIIEVLVDVAISIILSLVGAPSGIGYTWDAISLGLDLCGGKKATLAAEGAIKYGDEAVVAGRRLPKILEPVVDLGRKARKGLDKAVNKGRKWFDEAVSPLRKRFDNFADEAGETIRKFGDDLATGACKLVNSFSADTLVATPNGEIPISEIAVGDEILAYNEVTGETETYPVTALISHTDEVVVYITIDDELIETTPEHPFYTEDSEWVNAIDLSAGDHIRRLDGTFGTVEVVRVIETTQPMYNFTVGTAHTYFVGDGQWLVHNASCLNDRYSNIVGAIQKPMFREASANAGSKTVSRLDEIPIYGTGWQGSKSGKTLGILEVPGQGDVILQSAAKGPSQLIDAGTPGFNGVIRSHVEGHSAAIFRLEGIEEATLYINKVPCSGPQGCANNLSRMLPDGARLNVIGPDGYRRTFTGIGN